MLKFDENKLSSLRSFDDVLKEKYGDADSEARKDFDASQGLVLCRIVERRA